VQIADSRLLGNAGGGVKAMGGASNTTTVINVSDSTISGGLEGALASTTNSDAWASIMVTRSTIHDTCNALHADATAAAGAGKPSVIVTNSTVTNNLVGLLQSGTTAVTVVKSLGNNYIGDNGSETGTLTTTPLR